MTITAPLFSELDLSDPDEQMKVTNNGATDIEWLGVRRIYTIKAKTSEFIPFHIIVRYLGDPRSDYKKTEMFQTPNGEKGVIPERRGELIRLSINYGLYHGKIKELPKVAPKVTVTTLNDVEIHFPIYDPQGTVYAYQTPQQSNIDARTEFERLQKRQTELEGRMAALLDNAAADDPDSGEAPDDSHPGM
jgi:hypothetical protein